MKKHFYTDPAIQAELEQWLLTPTPRTLTPRLRKHVTKSSGKWAFMIFGLVFLIMGSIFSYMFLPWSFLSEMKLNNSSPQIVQGTVTHVEKTNMSINNEQVWRNEVTFSFGNLQMISVGYTSGKSASAGKAVFVKVHPDKPTLNCPQNMRMSQGSGGSSFVIIFPIVGLA